MSVLPSASLILTYHRVAAGRDPLMQCVSPQRFAEQVERLATLADVVPLADITARGRGLRVAVTFDDGYADNWHVAARILRGAGMPATFSVVARILDEPGEFWWDRLEHQLLDDDGSRTLPDRLVVELGGRSLSIDIRTREGRDRALKALNRRLRVLPAADIARSMSSVAAQVGPPPPNSCDAHRLLTREEVRNFTEGGLFEVASHGMTHTMMSAVGADQENEEVRGAQQALEQATGRPVRTFAYPYGTATSLTRQTVRALRKAGFSRALVNTRGLVGRFSDRFRLPRHMVYDWTADQLEHELRRWVAA
ncbi:MAG: polysaccharide deacetylase family protein [Actinomycetota bacterium]|nr:polysaccharide deacetylase family protein [Actinomycetota bacterium]